MSSFAFNSVVDTTEFIGVVDTTKLSSVIDTQKIFAEVIAQGGPGPTGPQGPPGPALTKEYIIGEIDGINDTFTLSHVPATFLLLFKQINLADDTAPSNSGLLADYTWSVVLGAATIVFGADSIPIVLGDNYRPLALYDLAGTAPPPVTLDGVLVGNLTDPITAVPRGTSGQILTSNGPGADPSFEDAGGGGGLIWITESLRVDAPNDTRNVEELAVNAVTPITANADLSLIPRGDGAVLTNTPDGTSAGGDKRGTKAVDLQMLRSSADQVASGNNAVISGGQNNKASSSFSVVGGGSGNDASGGSVATISGGLNNLASGSNSFIGGGNNNQATATAVVSAGGTDNRSTANFASISGGASNRAAATYSHVGGGWTNHANHQFSTIPGGSFAQTNSYGQQAYASGVFENNGDAQACTYVLRNNTFGTGTFQLYLDGSGEEITIPTRGAITFKVTVIGRSPTDTGGFIINGVAHEDSGALIVDTTQTEFTLLPGSWPADPLVEGDLSARKLHINVQGATDTSILWVARVDSIELYRG